VAEGEDGPLPEGSREKDEGRERLLKEAAEDDLNMPILLVGVVVRWFDDDDDDAGSPHTSTRNGTAAAASGEVGVRGDPGRGEDRLEGRGDRRGEPDDEGRGDKRGEPPPLLLWLLALLLPRLLILGVGATSCGRSGSASAVAALVDGDEIDGDDDDDDDDDSKGDVSGASFATAGSCFRLLLTVPTSKVVSSGMDERSDAAMPVAASVAVGR
jgi:hypothetical protein